MSDLVPADEIESIVGVKRHPRLHFGRAVSAEKRVYILHSQECLDSGIDLRECEYSIALDRGIDDEPGIWFAWVHHQDRPVRLTVWRGRLRPFLLSYGGRGA